MLEIRLQPTACAMPELRATINYLQELAKLREGGIIAHEDRPDVSVTVEMQPGAPSFEGEAVHEWMTPPPDPAAVFGGAPVPPVPAAPPQLPPALPVPPVAASAPPLPPAVDIPPSAATAPTAAPGVDLDSRGLPWDHRIHASSKTKNQDGSWRAKRGLNDAALVKRVEDELRAVAAIPSPAAPPAAAVTVSAVPLPPPAAPVSAPTATAPMAPSAAPGSVPASPATASEPSTFPELMKALVPAMGRTQNPLTQERIIECLRAASGGVITALPVLATRQDLVPAVWAHLKPWAVPA